MAGRATLLAWRPEGGSRLLQPWLYRRHRGCYGRRRCHLAPRLGSAHRGAKRVGCVTACIGVQLFCRRRHAAALAAPFSTRGGCRELRRMALGCATRQSGAPCEAHSPTTTPSSRAVPPTIARALSRRLRMCEPCITPGIPARRTCGLTMCGCRWWRAQALLPVVWDGSRGGAQPLLPTAAKGKHKASKAVRSAVSRGRGRGRGRGRVRS